MASLRKSVKDWLSSVQSLLTAVALLLGGAWFLYQQTLKPELKIETITTNRVLAGNDNVWLVSIEVVVTNTGKVRERLDGGRMSIWQDNPPRDTPRQILEFPLSSLQLDPGESDQALLQTFQISSIVKTIEIDANYPVPASNLGSFIPASWIRKDEELVWKHKSIFDLAEPKK